MVSKAATSQLKRIKENICRSRKFFEGNYKRYNEFKKFVFESSMSKDDIATLKDLGKPQIEFNILESYISRLRGEFSKQEPSLRIKKKAGKGKEMDPNLIPILEGYLRNLEEENRSTGDAYSVYSDQLSGGFSAWKVWTEYEHNRSFQQVIKYGRVYDPTMTGFDPLARQIHKGDGDYCFEIYPLTIDEFKKQYPNVDISKVTFTTNMEGFSFSYNNNGIKILLLVDYYEKIKKPEQIVELSDGQVMTVDEYNEFLEDQEEFGTIEQAPMRVGKPRKTVDEIIHRYTLIENQILSDKRTDFKYLPIIFVDGNSVVFRDIDVGEVKQMTRPYVYQAKGMQKLKNFAGQSLANELENMVQHKIMIAKESISDDYVDPLTDIQHASVLVWNAFKDNNPDVPLPPPREIVRPPIPAEITNTFKMADETTQVILGSYDAALGINKNQLSGVAIVEGATQSNSAAMPYIVSYMLSLSQVGRVILDLIPKYIISETNINIIDQQGETQSVPVNGQNQMGLNFKSQFLEVTIKAGVNFEIQKSRTLNQVIALMKVSPMFAQLINTKGLMILIDNLDIRGSERLKALSKEFIEQQQQSPPPPNPAIMEQQNIQKQLQNEQEQNQVNNKLKAGELALKKESNDTDRLKVMTDLEQSRNEHLLTQEKVSTEQAGQAVQMAIKAADIFRKHDREDRESDKS